MSRTLPILLASAIAAGASVVHADDPGKLVTVLTAPEPQNQLMAMVLTMQAASNGTDAHVLLCGPAADIALRDAPDSATTPQAPRGMSPQGLMKTLMEQTGTTVEVCAIYLPNAELDASALIDGVTPADPAAMAARLVAEDTRILGL